MTKKRVLIAIHNLRTGGAEILVKNIILGLDKDRYDVSLFVCELAGEHFEQIEAAGIHVYALKRYFSRFDLTILYHAYRILKVGQFEVVHTHLLVCNIYVRAAALLAGCGKIVVHEHGGDLKRPPLVRLLYFLLQAGTERFIYVSRHDLDHFSKLDGIRSKEKLTVLPNPCVFSDHAPVRYRSSIKSIGMVGQLNAMKGHIYALEAFVELKRKGLSFEYHLVGDGVLRQSLQNYAGRYGLKIDMPGIVKNITSFYDGFDLLIQPSLSEGFGMVIVEAMSCAVPVIATRVGGIPEIIEDGYNGILVNPASSFEICRAVLKLHENPDFYARLSINARQTALERFSLPRFLGELDQIYSS